MFICKEHQCGISLKWLRRHFQEEHKHLSLESRQEIFNYASSRTMVEPEALCHPVEIIPAIIGLKIIQGYRCEYEGCIVIYGTIESVKQHCKIGHTRKEHNGAK